VADGYRLEPLRGVRERAEVVRRGNLASKIDDARVTAAVVVENHARSEAARAALTAALATREAMKTAWELGLAESYVHRRRKELAAALDEELRAQLAHDQRETDVDVARGQLVRARAERLVIENHFARWREDKRKRAENAAD
jgi:hypothetical protein